MPGPISIRSLTLRRHSSDALQPFAGGTAMSYLSLLFASKAARLSSGVRESHNPQAEIRMEDWNLGSPTRREEGEQTLPSGVASMEHWLDLNA
jgi:hypothetical protein